MAPVFLYGICRSLRVESLGKRVSVFPKDVTNSGTPIFSPAVSEHPLISVSKMVPDESGLFRYCVSVIDQGSRGPHPRYELRARPTARRQYRSPPASRQGFRFYGQEGHPGACGRIRCRSRRFSHWCRVTMVYVNGDSITMKFYIFLIIKSHARM